MIWGGIFEFDSQLYTPVARVTQIEFPLIVRDYGDWDTKLEQHSLP